MSRTTIIIAIALTILLISSTYVGRKLFNWLHLVIPYTGAPRGSHVRVFALICLFFFLSIALAFMPFDMGAKKPLVWFAWFMMGIFIYCVVFFAISDVVLLAGKLLRIIPAPTPQKIVMATGWIVLVLVAGMAGYGTYHAKQIKLVSYTIRIKKETPLKKLNIVLVADIHLGYLNDDKWLAKIVDDINALQPDLVVMAGDVFNDNFKGPPSPDQAIRLFKSIKSRYGVYACLGNHDVGKTYGEMLRILEQGHVVLLQDKYRVVEDKFIMVGRTEARPIAAQGEPRKELSQVLNGVDMNMPIIVMDHNPANMREYGMGIDLILSGHTHKGQMFPGNIIIDLVYKVDYGHYQKDADNPHVIVTSGAGVWGPPFRVGTNNEIVNILVDFM